MKKLFILSILLIILHASCIYAQKNTGKETFISTNQVIGLTGQACDLNFDYNTPTGWNSDARLYSNNCNGLVWLTGNGIQTQGTHSFISGKLQFTNIKDASMYRVYNSFSSVLSNSFTADFEAKINNQNNANAVGFILFALTENNTAPIYDPVTLCSSPTNNSGILVSIDNSGIGSPMTLSVISKKNSSVNTVSLPFIIQSGITYYFRMIRKSSSKIVLQIFNDVKRNSTPLFTSNCIDIDPTIDGLKYIQHANNPLGAYSRTFTGTIDSVCIKNNTPDVCCTPKITGNNTICDAKVPSTFQININNGNEYELVLPQGVVGSLNPTNGLITINNWGAISTLPKKVNIKVKMKCNCDNTEVSYTVYVYPVRDTQFNTENVSSIGNQLSNFYGKAPIGPTGIIHQWGIFNSDNTGASIGWPNPIRPFFFQTSTGGNGYSVFTVNSTGVPSYPDLQTGHYYVVFHGLTFDGNICGWAGSTRLIFIGNNNKIIDVGEPGSVEFKEKIKLVK